MNTPNTDPRHYRKQRNPHVALDVALHFAGRPVLYDIVAACATEFPPPAYSGWHTFAGEHEHGKQEGRASTCGPAVAALHGILASDWWLDWLRDTTGIDSLVADPDRVGGGVHQTAHGGRLDLHTDFTVHPNRPELERRVNVLVFVDPVAYDESYGGMLELGSPGDAGRVGIMPRRGVVAVFDTTPTAWHGHPEPWAHSTRHRRSVPAYYYAPRRDGIEAKSTTWWQP